jgi:16S rRNA (guanine527-N7)-methyltransferase
MMFHVKHEGSPGALPANLSAAQHELLIRYEAHIAGRGAAIGVVAASDLPRLRERHVMDGLRGVDLLPVTCATAVDLGSGGGVPGIPIAIARPDVEVVLVEVRRNRAAFLEFVVDDLRLPNAQVYMGRAEQLERRFQACFARAFAPPAETWAVAQPLLTDGGVLLYWAGARFDPARDVPPDVQVRVPQTDPLAYGGPVVIMGPR